MGGRIDEGMPRMANERLPERSIPDRSPGHAFIAIAHAGWCRHTKVLKLGALVDRRVQVSSGPPAPHLAGDKPQRYISLLRPWAVVVRATVVRVAGRRRNSSRIGVRDMLSYQ